MTGLTEASAVLEQGQVAVAVKEYILLDLAAESLQVLAGEKLFVSRVRGSHPSLRRLASARSSKGVKIALSHLSPYALPRF